jgi:hypothetical protein
MTRLAASLLLQQGSSASRFGRAEGRRSLSTGVVGRPARYAVGAKRSIEVPCLTRIRGLLRKPVGVELPPPFETVSGTPVDARTLTVPVLWIETGSIKMPDRSG